MTGDPSGPLGGVDKWLSREGWVESTQWEGTEGVQCEYRNLSNVPNLADMERSIRDRLERECGCFESQAEELVLSIG